MYWCGAAVRLLGAGAALQLAAAQVVTITQYPSTCSAVYTSGSRSVTIIQSTVTVSPIPWTDDLANSGTPFVLQAVPASTGTEKRQAASSPRWIARDGYLTTDGSRAAQYLIVNDELTTASGGFIVTENGVANKTFALSEKNGGISITFRTQNGGLVWGNPSFEDGAAEFYQTQDSVQSPARAIVRFSGPVGDDWISLRLTARPVSVATQSDPGMSSTAVVSSVGGDMSSMQPSNNPGGSPDPYTTPPYSYQPTSQGQDGQGTTNGQAVTSRQTPASPAPADQTSRPIDPGSSMMSASQPASPSSTLPTSPEGICGEGSGFSCSDDNCCGQYGFCGTGEDYCGTGCQPAFGSCFPVPSNSPSLPEDITSTLLPPEQQTSIIGTVSMPIPQTTFNNPAPTSGVPPAGSTFACPRDDGQTVTDNNGVQYSLECGSDTTVGSYASRTVQNGFNDCFSLCDESDNCLAFTFEGGENGVGFGICYLKNQPAEFVAGGNEFVGAIRIVDTPGSPTSAGSSPSGAATSGAAQSSYEESPVSSTVATQSTYSAGATPIGPNNPGGPDRPSSMSMGVSSVTSVSSSGPSPTLLVSPNGHCGTQGNGGSPEGYTCASSVFGTCCSSSGFCGSTSEYCLGGCQTAYGECTPQESSTTIADAGTSVSSSVPTPTIPVSPNGHCGTQGDGGSVEGFTCTTSVFGTCCSSSGYCGDTAEYCLGGCQSDYGACTPQDGNPITATGFCGADNGNQTCTGGIFGECCSNSGYCGDGDDYCLPDNCDPLFGTCDGDSSSTMEMMSSTSMPDSMPTSLSTMQMVSSSSSAEAIPSSSSVANSIDPYPSSTSSTPSAASSLAAGSSTPSPTPSSSSAATTTTTSTTPTTTSTTTTTSSSSSSSLPSSSSAYLVLPSPTPCNFGDPPGYDEDDSYCLITLPFPVQMYAQSDANTYASTNGFLSIQYGSALYASQRYPASNIPNKTVAPFFDDLALVASASPTQGIFYQVQGSAVTYEWYVGRLGQATQIYQFTIRYDSAVPGVFTFTYYNTGGSTDQGEFASVGTQGKNAAGAQVGFTYMYHAQSLAPGLVVVCDTTQNTCITQT